MEIYCGDCDFEFEGEAWVDDECPKCGRKYCWEELISEDGSDSWAIYEWQD